MLSIPYPLDKGTVKMLVTPPVLEIFHLPRYSICVSVNTHKLFVVPFAPTTFDSKISVSAPTPAQSKAFSGAAAVTGLDSSNVFDCTLFSTTVKPANLAPNHGLAPANMSLGCVRLAPSHT